MIYLVCAMCGIQSMLCAGFSQCYVRDLVCVMCGMWVIRGPAEARRAPGAIGVSPSDRGDCGAAVISAVAITDTVEHLYEHTYLYIYIYAYTYICIYIFWLKPFWLKPFMCRAIHVSRPVCATSARPRWLAPL